MIEWLKKNSVDYKKANKVLKKERMSCLKQNCKAIDILRRPGIGLNDIKHMFSKSWPEILNNHKEIFHVEIAVKYEGYIKKQQDEINRLKEFDNIGIPGKIEYKSINGLLTESRQKLEKIRPQTIGQALRISGVTPADITILIGIVGNKRKSINIE